MEAAFSKLIDILVNSVDHRQLVILHWIEMEALT